MKKSIGMFVALATVATIGGAYATWTYISHDVDDTTATQSIAITEKVTGVVSGEITVTPNNDAFVIGNNGEYVTIWEPYADDNTAGIAIVFTPTDATNCYNTSFTYTLELTVAEDKQTAYNETPIFEEEGTVSGTITYTTGQANASAVITAETVKAWLTVNKTTLDTESKYDSFTTLLSGCTITVTVTENK